MNNIYGISLVGSVIVAAASQIILKTSANIKHESIIKEYLNVRVVAGYVLMVLSTLLAIFAYSKIELKNGPIIETLGYPLVIILGAVLLKERLNKKRIVGMSIILIGIIVFYL